MQIKCEKCSAVTDAAMSETYLEGEVHFATARGRKMQRSNNSCKMLDFFYEFRL